MRIAELSHRSGVSIPTIKYYLREGLLAPGERIGRNQAAYGEEHLHRLRLIRALREVGGLSVAAAGQVLATLADPPPTLHELMGQAHQAVIPTVAHDHHDPDWRAAREQARDWLQQLGWQIDLDGPAIDELADVFIALRRLGQERVLTCLPTYAAGALTVAQAEVSTALAAGDPAQVMATVVTGTVLGERLLAAVRLLAHEHVSATMAGAPPGCDA